MQNTAAVGCFHTAGNPYKLFWRHRALFFPYASQFPAFDVFHHNKLPAGESVVQFLQPFNGVNNSNVGMI